MMKMFLKNMFKGFVYTWAAYSIIMFYFNIWMWLFSDESEQVYQPVFNIFNI